MEFRPMKFRQRILFLGVVTTVILGLATVLCQQSVGPNKTVTPAETLQLASNDSSVVLLDVRTVEEYRGGHIARTILIPVQELESRIAELDDLKSKKIIAICRSGNRSNRAAAILEEHGFEAYNMVGGMLKWNAEGYPVIQGEEQ